MRKYDYSALIKDAEFEVEYYSEQFKKAESSLFRSRLALEQLQIRQAANNTADHANAENA